MDNQELQMVIKEHEMARIDLKAQDKKLNEHFFPLLQKAVKEKDKRKFSKILDQCPDCFSKMYMYELGYDTEML